MKLFWWRKNALPIRPRGEETGREAAAPVDRLFLDRWSPRAFLPEPLPAETARILFEAARWSPSCFNEQPWLFVYAADPAGREKILGTLNEGNRAWARNAPILAVLFARRKFGDDGELNRWAGFDCGAAWMSLALEARLLGLYAHAMGGFSRESAHSISAVPEDQFDAMCVIAVGKRGDPALLPENFRAREKANSERKLPGEIALPVST